MRALLLLTILLGICTTKAADEQPRFGVGGKCVFQPDFASGQLDKTWQIIKGKWEVQDGVLRGAQIPEQNHAAVLRHDLAIRDFMAEFEFKFDAGKAIKLVINKNTVHIATISFWPGELTIDKQPERNSAQQLRRLDARKVSLSTSAWHKAVIQVIGNFVVAVVDDRFCVLGSDDGLSIDKTDVDFAANGETALKSIRFLEATAPADADAEKRKLQEFRDAPQP